MAKRRMISVDVYGTDRFGRLPVHSQMLYSHLVLQADDDGFVDNVENILRVYRLQRRHYQALVDSGYLIVFESGVVVITHWFVMNRIRADRYTKTNYKLELSLLKINEEGRYIKA